MGPKSYVSERVSSGYLFIYFLKLLSTKHCATHENRMSLRDAKTSRKPPTNSMTQCGMKSGQIPRFEDWTHGRNLYYSKIRNQYYDFKVPAGTWNTRNEYYATPVGMGCLLLNGSWSHLWRFVCPSLLWSHFVLFNRLWV